MALGQNPQALLLCTSSAWLAAVVADQVVKAHQLLRVAAAVAAVAVFGLAGTCLLPLLVLLKQLLLAQAALVAQRSLQHQQTEIQVQTGEDLLLDLWSWLHQVITETEDQRRLLQVEMQVLLAQPH